jgi:hypothetical protein
MQSSGDGLGAAALREAGPDKGAAAYEIYELRPKLQHRLTGRLLRSSTPLLADRLRSMTGQQRIRASSCGNKNRALHHSGPQW